jgi:hypothetical protein
VFETGNATNSANLFTIVKMGMVLKSMTLGESALNADEEEKEEHSQNASTNNQRRDLKHLNDPEWVQFCNGPL